MKNIILTIFVLIFSYSNSFATVLYSDDFEYGSDAAGCTNVEALPSWQWDNCTEVLGTVNVISSGCYSGRCLDIDFAAGNSNTYIMDTSAAYTDDVWVQVRAKYTLDSGSETTGHDFAVLGPKAFYANYNNAPTYTQAWVVGYKTGVCGDGSCYSDNDGYLAINEICMKYMGPGGATAASKQNYNNTVHASLGQWFWIIYNINTDNGTVRMWIDIGNGFVQIMDHALDGTACDPGNGSNMTIGWLKFGTVAYDDAHYYYDNIVVATSSDDMDWGDTTAPTIGTPGGSFSIGAP